MSATSETNQSAGHVAQLRELFDARVALAKIEVEHDIACSKRLGVIAGIGAVCAIIGLTLLMFVLSESLANWTQTEPLWWRLAFGIVLAGGGGAAIFLGWKTFRREFSALRETRDELREDRDWAGEMFAELMQTAGVTPPSSDGA